MADESRSEPSAIAALARAAQVGGLPEHDTLIATFLEAIVVVPSSSDPTAGPLAPVLVDIDGTPHMVVCDTLEAVRGISNLASYAASMRGRDVVRGVQPGTAVFVRCPDTGFAIDTGLLDEIRAQNRDA